MYEAFREVPQSKKDRSRLKLGAVDHPGGSATGANGHAACVGVPAERGIPPVYGRSER